MKRSAIALARGARIGVLSIFGVDGAEDGAERGRVPCVAIPDEERK
jgi:hypothetical protein